MSREDTLMTPGTEIIDRVVEEGLYNYWNSPRMNKHKLTSRKIASYFTPA